eukprot:GEMP01057721.1.p1 GENE.GEMP01057721.1~~GEMP01057721.1.p1  ORF type:complete len:389 (+),score=89.42 GEMP01057721.1:70-1236(+)
MEPPSEHGSDNYNPLGREGDAASIEKLTGRRVEHISIDNAPPLGRGGDAASIEKLARERSGVEKSAERREKGSDRSGGDKSSGERGAKSGNRNGAGEKSEDDVAKMERRASAPKLSSERNPWWVDASLKDKSLLRPSSDQPPRQALLEKEKNPWWSLRDVSNAGCHNLPQRPQSDQPHCSVRPSWQEVAARAQKPDGSVRASPPVVWQNRKNIGPVSLPEDDQKRWKGLAMPEPLRQLPLQVLEAGGYEDFENDGPLVNLSNIVHYLHSVVTQIETNIANGNIPTKEKLYAFKDRLIRTLHKWIKRNVPREHKVHVARVLLADISKRPTTQDASQDSPENLWQEILNTIAKLNAQQQNFNMGLTSWNANSTPTGHSSSQEKPAKEKLK